jgi:hypothetical protein
MKEQKIFIQFGWPQEPHKWRDVYSCELDEISCIPRRLKLLKLNNPTSIYRVIERTKITTIEEKEIVVNE